MLKGSLEARMQLSKVLGTNPYIVNKEIETLEANTGNTLVFYPFDEQKAAAILFANDNKHVFSYLKDGKIVEVSLDENSKVKVIIPADQSTVLKINPYMHSDLKALLVQVIEEEFKQQVTIYGEFNLSDNEKAIKAMNEVIKPYILNYPDDKDLDKFDDSISRWEK